VEFQVKAVKNSQMQLLTVSANHADDAMAQVTQKGYVPVSAKQTSKKITLNKKSDFELSLFSQELLALLDAGLNLVESIETLAVKDKANGSKLVLDQLLNSLYQGQTFSTALQEQPEVFPTLYVATVKASENTGNLPEALTRYVAFESQVEVLKKKIISASIYPALLIGVGGLVIFFLMGFVVPKFSGIYEGTSGELPFLSKLMLSWGQFLAKNGMLVLAAVVVMVFLLVYVLSLDSVRQALLKLLWKVPAIGKRLKLYQLSRFYRTLGMLLKGGTPIIEALSSVAGLLDPSLQQRMKTAANSISQGQQISNAMAVTGLTTPVAERMLLVGERSGNIGEMMDRIASFYDEELARWIDWFTKLFEPILMLMIGLVIGVVVLLLYMPIFELAGNIQ